MASDRQIAANQRNALLSTGPRTEAGKAISRRNALDHGLRAEQLMLDGEDPVAFETLRDELVGEFAPTTAYGAHLVDRLATLVWRLRRIAEFEAAILKWVDYRQAVIHDRQPRDATGASTSILRAREYKGLIPANDSDTEAVRDQLRLGRLLEAEMNKNLTAKLGRHEAHLMRQLKATRQELAEHQAAQPAREAGALEGNTSRPLPTTAVVSFGADDRSERDDPVQSTAASEPIGD